MKKITYNILSLLGIIAFMVPSLSSCSDEPDAENFYAPSGGEPVIVRVKEGKF